MRRGPSLVAVTLALAACSSAPDAPPATDARPPGDAPSADAAPATTMRGKYLVDHVAACGDCHTPRLAPAPPIPRATSPATRACSTSRRRIPSAGCLATPNLTGSPTGSAGARTPRSGG